MYTGFELFLFQINLIFHLLMKNWKVFQISQKRKPKFLILAFGICMYLTFFFKKYHFLVNLLLFLNCKYFGLAKPLKFMLWLLSLQKI